METAGRLHVRYRIQIPVDVRIDRRWTTLVTEDVGTGGLFVRTDAPGKPRQLVQLKIELPAALGPFKANAVIVRAVAPGGEAGKVPGMAFAFYGIGKPEQEHWDRFLSHIAKNSPGSSEKPLSARRVNVVPPDELRLRSPALQASLEVRIAEVEDLFVIYSRDVSRGGIFLLTEETLADGAEVAISVVHAASRTQVWLRAVVRRNVQSRGSRGMGIDLVMDESEQRTLRAALNQLVDALEEVVVNSTRFGDDF